ncbi:MAG: hypothetical protein WC249_03740 [Patescibacteria group bacterium]|jgi:hypothetical protein
MAYSNFYARFYDLNQRIGSSFAAVWRFRPSRFYLLTWGLLHIIVWWQAIFIFRNLIGNFLVLHYNVDFGVDLVGDPVQILYYPLYALGIGIINLIIVAALNQNKDFRIFVHLLLATAVLFALFLNLVLLFIYLINFK